MKHVYFIKPVGMLGPIKIGCSICPKDRLTALQMWSPIPLEIIARVPTDGHGLERKIHHYFADLHSHKEWFTASAELLQFVADVKRGVHPESLLDPAKPRGSLRLPKVPTRPTVQREDRFGAV